MLMLTIAIPTYNRHEKLLKTLNNICLFKDCFEIEIIILDNFSNPPVSDYMSEKGYSGFDYTHIYRNNGNIGSSANVLNCFIHTKSDWMWLLGDDDLPLSNCLVDIFNEIQRANENDFLIKFNSDAGEFPEVDTSISNEEEFVRFCSNIHYYSNMLFISNSIFRTNSMQRHLRLMFEFTNTMAPQIIGILENVSESRTIRIVNKVITEHGSPQGEDTWDLHIVKEGVLYLSDVKDHNLFSEEMVKNLLLNYIAPKRFFIAFFVYPFRYKSYSVAYWRWFYRRSSYIFSGFKSLYLLLLSVNIRFYYKSRLVNKILSRRVINNPMLNSDRY
jgi:glycosyltransferase involved in cell wall biosynthesis